MDLHLNGKRAVVTGASKGIGLAITRALAAEGVRVVAGARTITTELSDLAARSAVHPVPVDLATPDGPARLMEAAIAELGGLDILVNNVGAVRPRPAGFTSVTDDDWSETLTINFLAPVRMTRAAIPHLLESSRATIVTVNSVNARLPDPLVIDYCAAKAALANFSKSLSKELAPHGVRVTTVSPGPVATALWLGPDGVAATVARATGDAGASAGTDGGTDGSTVVGTVVKPEEVADQVAKQSATGRFTEPDEVADLVLLLASDRAANMTGADITIDGGLITTL